MERLKTRLQEKRLRSVIFKIGVIVFALLFFFLNYWG
jgi:hypothetical protein